MPQQYSYVRAANAGFATLAVDRLGTGDCDRPTPELVSVHAAASTIHQIVSAVRSGTVDDAQGLEIEFHRIVLVSHSFGSNISWTEAGIYGDVDGLVLTAISHDQNPPAAPLTVTDAWPARSIPSSQASGCRSAI
jgi:pimeloyl-ACP methyl ester carboxylesterase